MNWAISNLTGSNRVSRAILVRYSQVPLAEAESTPQTPSASSTATNQTSSSSSSSFAATFLHASRHVPGRAVPRNAANHNHNSTAATAATQLSLPLDVEETVTCFCR
ncbi:MOB kinase activator-like 2 [Calliphora vicina]|uniref:MOB kinase activator-like 2 n=1 Tax=Calliphora vicina TaxID=7373 RepID=UPI00325AC636